MSHGFEDFCLSSSNSIYSVQNQVIYVFTITQIPGMTPLPLILTAKKIHEDNIFDRQDILQFFSGVSKDYKYVKSQNIG